MPKQIDPTIFDTLNARLLTPSQIAQSFIPPDQFDELVQRNNNIIIGPRGSGKTTLLKMLQLPALVNWRHRKAKKILDDIDFVSVFIPTDRAWLEQWSLIEDLNLLNKHKDSLRKAIFITHTVRQMIETLRYCVSAQISLHPQLKKFYLELNKNTEREIVTEVSNFLGLKREIPSIEYLKLALQERLSNLGVFLYKNIGNEKVVIDDQDDYIHGDLMQTITYVVEVINTCSNRQGLKWALCFDELEIAPKEIVQALLYDLRSTAEQTIMFKLSISPYAEDFDIWRAENSSAGNDYVPINLTYPRKEKARPFCENLFRQMCVAYGVEGTHPKDVFGLSEFDMGREYSQSRKSSAYDKDSPVLQRFERLFQKDSTFRKFCKDNNINFDDLGSMPDIKRAPIRKLTTIVCLRDRFIKENGTLSSSQEVLLYTGYKTIFDVTEGNPRLFLRIVKPLLKKFVETKKIIDRSHQAESISIARDQFIAHIKTIPISVDSSKHKGVYDLLEKIGLNFQHKILRDEFSADPATSFIVDSNTPPDIIQSLGKAINAGAIIYIHESEETPLLDSLVGKRFRLSHLLASKFKLPLVVNKPINLSSIFLTKGQRNLFDEFDEF